MPQIQLINARRYFFKGKVFDRGQVVEVSNRDRNYLVLERGRHWRDYSPEVDRPPEPVVLPDDGDDTELITVAVDPDPVPDPVPAETPAECRSEARSEANAGHDATSRDRRGRR